MNTQEEIELNNICDAWLKPSSVNEPDIGETRLARLAKIALKERNHYKKNIADLIDFCLDDNSKYSQEVVRMCREAITKENEL